MPESTSHHWSDQHVEQIARLARIQLSDTELESTSRQLRGLLQHINQLNQVDIPATFDPLPEIAHTESSIQNDQPRPSIDRNVMLKNAPETDGQFYLVPQRTAQE